MALEVGNVVKITANQTFLGQLMQNVFFYWITDLPGDTDGYGIYEYIAVRFNAIWGIDIRSLQSTLCKHTVYRVDNVSNGIDFGEYTVNVDGLVSGDAAPSFNALNVLLRRSTGITRNGSKRIGGIPESLTTGNTINLSDTDKANYEALFSEPLSTADSVPVDFAMPVIVGRQLFTPTEGEPYYVLDLTKLNPIQSALISAASTQRSRKAGKGT
jgi:hypothetical protein